MKNMRPWLVLGGAMVVSATVIGCGAAEDGSPSPSPSESAAAQQVDSLKQPMGKVTSSIATNNLNVATSWKLLARVEIQENEMVEFYEPAPGRLFISAAGAPTGAARSQGLDWSSGDFEGVWASMTHNAAIPAELAAAVQRVRDGVGRVKHEVPAGAAAFGSTAPPAQAAPSSIPSPAAPSADLGSTAQALSNGWCNTSWYSTYDSGYGAQLSQCSSSYFTWTVCWDHVTGNGSAWHDDALDGRMNVCPYTGNITYTVSADESWVPQGSWTVGENSYRYVTAFDPGCDAFPWTNDCPYVKAAVTNASGDAYNYRFIIHQR